jgi:phenylacetate-CoA ligase
MVDCPCGRTYPTLPLGIYGRTDDMMIVRGQNVFPSRIEDILRGMREFGGEFRLILERDSGQLDRLTVQTEVDAESYSGMEHDPAALEPLRQRIADELRRAIGVGVAVEIKPAGEFDRTQFKARRVIDRRTL